MQDSNENPHSTSNPLPVVVGNAAGAANYNYGVIGAQTLRAAAQIGNSTGEASFNYGAVSGQTVRTAAQLGNATGAADFNVGPHTAQTLRTVGAKEATYSVFASFTAAASPTDVFTLTGSATKTIRISHVHVSGTNTANTNARYSFIKRSAANTGGTSTTPTIVPFDSTNAAVTAVARRYTANPAALGAAVGTFGGGIIFLPVLASTNPVQTLQEDFGMDHDQGITLRGTSELFSVSFNGAALGGTTVLDVAVRWVEE